MADLSSAQIFTFKDCVARGIITSQQDSTDDASKFDDFASYLALESWTGLPLALRTTSYETRSDLPDLETLPLDATSTSFVDTLVSYRFSSESEAALKFLRKTIQVYVLEACAPPPVWSSTRTKECEICEREGPLTYHHLIPRSTHAKVLKKKWHSEGMLNSVAWLCRPCHSAVHHVAANEELARHYHTVDLLLEREDIQKWRGYAEKQRFGVRRG